ncbi:type II toxin-antitoxin system RelE/ParE family toxin [Actinobacillus arthritidis]|uniref:type II toxin-antitoxin system RelE/ParE family toxin n=1 Tax=Actinobacillus arthritidis TaxID=157339 RepID=UPI0024416A27|nr:type II toxin-antitoxin system RelE/ParE family toxin [Actinobacillus arthritidis]WGE90071.1 type II toxin-antitoxin system RelE/ParE family toxin [Actinobacillus arthritidis]
MRHKIIYTHKSLDNIDNIVENITAFVGNYSAMNVLSDIKSSIDLLAYMPMMGVQGYIKGTREIYPRQYRVVYMVNDLKKEIIILTILHTRRLYPPLA